jgi:hypothetical protein
MPRSRAVKAYGKATTHAAKVLPKIIPEAAPLAPLLAREGRWLEGGETRTMGAPSQPTILTDTPKLITTREARIRVIRRGKVSYILFEPSRGLNGKETAATVMGLGLAYAGWRGYKDAIGDVSKAEADLNPENWFGGLTKWWGTVKWPKL